MGIADKITPGMKGAFAVAAIDLILTTVLEVTDHMI
jgi:hypothetical protein